jgi:hypothetical protein
MKDSPIESRAVGYSFPVNGLTVFFWSEAGACVIWSVGDTGCIALSEHPTSTNATLAFSNRAYDKAFMALPFIIIVMVGCVIYAEQTDTINS